MKRTMILAAAAALVLASVPVWAGETPPTYELQLVYLFEAVPAEHVFVIGSSGFKSVAALERFLATQPAGTTLRWSPGCERLGGEPLLSSEQEMARFVAFCRAHRINFILVPSG